MRGRGPRLVLAVLITAGVAAFGTIVAAPAAHAANRASPALCGLLNPCPPTFTISGVPPSSTGGVVTVTWKSAPNMFSYPPSATVLTVMWVPAVANLPAGAPQPAPSTASAPATCSPPTQADLTCTYTWPLLDNSYVLNGTYQLSASAKDCALGQLVGQLGGCSAPTSASETVSVANAPSAPTNVTAAVVPNSPTVKISWEPSPEPDVVGYRVLRADGSLACSLATFSAPESYSCIDAPTKDGAYSYRVVAYRWGPTYSEDITNEPASPPSAATRAVTVTGTAANSATTVPSGGGGTLGPGGFTARAAPSRPGGVSGVPTFRAAPAVTAGNPPATADPGFNPVLPYGRTTTSQPGTTDPAVIGAPPAPHKSAKGSVGTIAAVGAGLLIAVIAGHGLWLRSEVRRSGVLEVLDPEH